MARGIRVTEQPRNRGTILSLTSRVNMICKASAVEHRLTKPNLVELGGSDTSPGDWVPTNGQVERTRRTIKDVTKKRHHYDCHDELRQHLDIFLDITNHACRLKTFKGLTRAQLIWKEWQSRPDVFHEEPYDSMAGLNTLCVSTRLEMLHRRSRPRPATGWDMALNTL